MAQSGKNASSSIDQRAAFSWVRYANCWEDAHLLLKAFEPLRGQRFVSICSAGDNTLALLTLDPSELVAADLNPAQLACLELRMVAWRHLDYEDLLAFLGIRPTHGARTQVYQSLASELSSLARSFWDTHLEDISLGIIFAGKFERYFAKFRRYVLPWVQSQSNCDRLLGFTHPKEQREFYDRSWNHWRWRLLFRVFFSKWIMGRSGRDPEFFRYVKGSVAQRILQRTEQALYTIPGAENPWLQFIVGGNFSSALPPYLQPEHFQIIRERLGVIRFAHGPIPDILGPASQKLTAWNLSDIFEYMDPPLFAHVVKQIMAHSSVGSRLAYWNMLVPRDASQMTPALQSLSSMAQELFVQDRAFFYSAFHIDEAIHLC